MTCKRAFEDPQSIKNLLGQLVLWWYFSKSINIRGVPLPLETLSSVLTPAKKDGSGALVMMYFTGDNSLSISVVHSGIAKKKTNCLIDLALVKKKKKVKVFHINVQSQVNNYNLFLSV